jgi:hypothetical protein
MPLQPPPSTRQRTRKGAAPRAATPPAGGTPALPLPHELDESVGHVASAPDPVIEQASKDIEAGLVDTDMRATPGLDAARRRRLVPTPDPKVTSTPRTPRR